MKTPLALCLALTAALTSLTPAGATEPAPAARAPGVATPGPTGPIPMDAGPTAARLRNLAADPSYESYRRGFDGESALAPGSAGYTLKNPIGPVLGTGAPNANPRPTTVSAPVPASNTQGKGKFFDDTTIGFVAMGGLLGALLGVALVGTLGMAGPFLGAVLGAALLVGLWKSVGYKKPEEK